MRQHVQNGWFARDDFHNTMNIIQETAQKDPIRWLTHGIDCKYVEVRVDMRTGDFILLNAFGDRLTNEFILNMFPAIGTIEPFQSDLLSK